MSDADDLLLPRIGPPNYDEGWDRIDNHYFDRKGNPISMRDWCRLREAGGIDYVRVARTDVGPYFVSTVWLGLDHGMLGRGRQIFESMGFEQKVSAHPAREAEEIQGILFPARSGFEYHEELDCCRYATEEEALAGHQKMVERLELFCSTSRRTINERKS